MRLNRHIYDWENIVVGSDLRSLVYAAKNNTPVIFTNPVAPFRFNMIQPHEGLAKLGFAGKEEVSELQVWERMFFILGLSGLCPLSSAAQSIRVKDDTVVITTSNQRVVKAKFNKLLVFEDYHLQTLPDVDYKQNLGNEIFDWIDVRYGCRHKLDVLYGEDEFVSRIHFYPTERSDNKTLKDAVAVSTLSDQQLENLDYSEYMARFKVEQMMRDAGIKGPINGYRNKKPVFLSIKTEHSERQVMPKIKTFYRPDSRYEFRYDSIEEVLVDMRLPPYSEKVVNML